MKARSIRVIRLHSLGGYVCLIALDIRASPTMIERGWQEVKLIIGVTEPLGWRAICVAIRDNAHEFRNAVIMILRRTQECMMSLTQERFDECHARLYRPFDELG